MPLPHREDLKLSDLQVVVNMINPESPKRYLRAAANLPELLVSTATP